MTISNTLPQRVVVIAGYARSLIHFRGPLLQAMRAQGHQIIALAPEHDQMAQESAEEIGQQLAELGIHFIPIPLARTGLNPREDAASLKGLVRLLRELRPDAVFSYTIKPVIYGSLAARLAGVPRIYAMVTGLGYTFANPSGDLKRRGLNLLVQHLYKQAFAACTRVIFQNPDDRNQLVGLGLVGQEKTAIVNGSGLDLEQFTPAPLPSDPIFLLIARLLPEKGIREYVEAAYLVRSERPRARFLLLGPLDTSPGAYTLAEVARWRDGGVEYLGETKDVRPVLRQASVYVLPSYREGTPRTVLEAMAMGRPVITTDAPGCRETVIDGQTGYLVPVGDAPSLARRMLELADSPSLRESFGQAGVELAHSKYDVHQVNRSMLGLMQMLPEVSQAAGLPDHRFSTTDLLWRAGGKRGFDVMVAASALGVLSLPLGLLALLISQQMGSPVLFQQQRPGRFGKPFMMYKFRTMTNEHDSNGELLPDAQRLTAFGRWLRSTSLDELPELLNVLRGEMSLVGPRPLLMRYTRYFTEEEMQRLNVRPGITGWAQVNGRNTVSWDERLALDVWYVQNKSFALDLRILWLTLLKVVQRSGLVVDPESIMQNLDDERRERSVT